MIIYNGDEIATKYMKKDEIMVEIRSTHKLEELLEKPRRGESLTENDAVITAYKALDGAVVTQAQEVRDCGTEPLSVSCREEYEDVIEEAESTRGERDSMFKAFEAFSFNRPWRNFQFETITLTEEQLKLQLSAALGIMPTVKDIPDKSVAELKKMSQDGDRLFWSFAEVSTRNPLPSKEDIEFYESLCDYERRVINESFIHPKRLLSIAKTLKEHTPGRFFTLEEEYKAWSIQNDERIIERAELTKCTYLTDEVIAKAEEIFKELYHGHAPRVLKEYMAAMVLAKSFINTPPTETQIREIAAAFDQKNVAKVAKYKNLVLFALAEKLNYNEMKEEHIQALAVYVRPTYINALLTKGFVNWYQANKDTNTSDLVEMLKVLDKIPHFDRAKSAKDHVTDLVNQKGKADCEQMERKYRYKFADNELAIRGRHVVAQQGKLKMYMLPADDYRNFTVGYDTHCCQHLGNAGESCVWKLTSDPFAGVVVIERDGDILAQGFVWTDEVQDTLVFDNVEFADDRKVQQFSDLFAAWSNAMPYQNIHVGVGYNQGMMGWGKKADYQATLPTTLSDNRIYSDYHADARSLKKNGAMQLAEKLPVRVTSRPDEETKWDVLARPATAFLLNDCHSSIESRLSFARAFLENPTAQIQLEAVRRNIQAIRDIEHPTEEVQKYVIEKDPQMALFINDPTVEVQRILISIDPNYIRNIQNPDEDMAREVVKKNGFLLTSIANPSDEVIRLAVEQNGYVIREVPRERQTDALQLAAVKSNPKVIAILPSPSERVQKQAIEYNPHVIGLMDAPSEELQLYAVDLDPGVINEIKEPTYNAVHRAVSKNGLLVRNFQYLYPQLRSVALAQNGFVINALRNPTDEEYVLAVQQNRLVLNSIRNPQLQANILAMIEQEENSCEIELD